MKPSFNLFAAALPLAAALTHPLAAAPLYWKTSSAAAWTSATWSSVSGGPYTEAWVSGSSVIFEDNLGTTLTITGPSATTNFSAITANENVTVTANSTLGTGGTIATVEVAGGKTLDFAGQSISTAAGTGFIKNGTGTWSLANGNTYPGGFTLNAGTVAVGGVNALGSGGALVINGGALRSNSGTARNLTGKYSSITLGGDVTLGDSVNTGALTFSANTDLGATTRTLTVNSAVTHTGAIFGSAGAGLTKAGDGLLTLSGTNTYSGPTAINAGVLAIGGTGSLPGFGTNGSYSVAGGAGLAVANAVTDGNITTMLGTTNFAAGAMIGFDTTAAARTYAVNLGNTAQGNLGLVKVGGTNALTLSGSNTYSGGTIISQTGDSVGIIAASSTALGSGTVLINGGQQFSAALSVNTNLTINNALTMKRGNGGSNRAVLSLGAGATWSGNITLDNSSPNGFASIGTGGTSAAAASIISGNIGYSTLGTFTSSAPTLAFRSGNSFGKVTGSISLSTGYVQLLDSSKWEFSNASNTWGTLDVSNASAIATVGAANTLSPTGIVTSTAGGTLQLNNQAGTTAYNQSIAGLSGNVKVGLATGAATLTLNTTTDQSSSGVISGAISLVKSGTAKQTLTGANTYTGSTTINGGTLELGSTGVMSTGDLSINSGTLDLRKGVATRSQTVNNLTLTDATLNIGLNATPDQINALGTTSASGTNTIKLTGATPVGVYDIITASAPLSGSFVLDTSGVTTNGFPVSYSGAISGNNYVLTVTGAATPYIAYWNGDVSSVWNESSLAPNSNWADNSSGTSDTGQIPGPITDVYFSTATATNTSTTLGADTNINSLTFETGSATVGGSHTLTLLLSSGYGIDVFPGATGTIATGAVNCASTTSIQAGGTLNANSGGLGTGPLLVDGTLNLNMNVTKEALNGAATGIITRGIAGAGTLTISGTTNSTYDGAINNGPGSILALAKSGSSTLTLGGNSNYTGGTTINGGILKANSSNAFGGGSVAITGGVRISLGDGVTLTNPITIGTNTSPQGGGLLEASNTVAGTATLEGPITINNNPAGGGHFINVSSGGTFNVKGVITSSVPIIHRNGTVTYWGGGTGYSAMSVTGTARVGANNGIATSATVTVGVSGAATLDLAGMNQSLAGIVKGPNAATIGNSSTTADSTLAITGTSTFDGVIANTVGAGTSKTGLSVAGGTLTLGGVNTYTGNTTIASGTSLVLSDNAQLRFAIDVTSNGISGAGSATINGDFNIDTTAMDASPTTSGTWTLENVTSTYGASFQVISGATAWTATGDVWTKTVGSKTYSFDEATGVLTLTSTGSGFDTWASSKGLTGGDAAFDADPDHDGLSNGLEYVLGGEPNPANAGSNSASLLPTVSESAGNLIFTFKRKDVSENDVNLKFQWSADLTFPSPASDVPIGALDSVTDTITVDVTEDSPDAETDTIVITVPASKAAGGKLFGRLVAVEFP